MGCGKSIMAVNYFVQAFKEENRSVVGADGILRSSIEVDFDALPKLKCCFAKHTLKQAKERINKYGDYTMLNNAILGIITA